MNNYILSCCSTADLSKEHFTKRDIHYVCFHFMLDDDTYPDDLGESIAFKDFYQKMRDGAMTKTSQVNVDEFMEYFRPFLENGQDILHLTLSSGISGVHNSACIARDMLLEEFPDRKIYIIDSLTASSAYGLIMETLADKRDAGEDIDTLYQWTNEHLLEMNLWFFSNTLTYYIRGGRVSKASGTIGNMLNICPMLIADKEGKLQVVDKIRTKRKTIKELVGKMEAYATNNLDYDGKCFITHSDSLEDAQAVAALVEEKFPKLNGKVQIFDIGTVIGSHTGPGTVTLAFWGKEREA